MVSSSNYNALDLEVSKPRRERVSERQQLKRLVFGAVGAEVEDLSGCAVLNDDSADQDAALR